MSITVSLPNHTFPGQALSSSLFFESAEGRKRPQKIFHDQSPQKNVAGPSRESV